MKRRLYLLLPVLLLSSCSSKEEDKSYSMFVKITDIETNTQAIDLYVGQTFSLTASAKPANATVKNLVFESDNSSVATISSTGLVSAKGQGTCSIVISSSDNDNKFKKLVPVTVTKEDRNRKKDGTIHITANLDLTSLLGENENAQVLNDNLNLDNSEVYAPIENIYNTDDNDFVDLTENVKILNDINYYGSIEGETQVQRNERIYGNMKVLLATSFAMNTVLSSMGASESSSYAKYHASILEKFGRLAAAKLLDRNVLGGNNLTTAIRNTPEQHSLSYINKEYLSNAKLESSNLSNKCTFYSYQKNDSNSLNFISQLAPLLNLASVNTVKTYVTKDNIDTILNLAKNNFDRLPASYSSYYELLRTLINKIDKDSYTVETSDIYSIPDDSNKNNAIDVKFSFTTAGLKIISDTLVDYITTRISNNSNEDLKKRITDYIDGLSFSKFAISLTLVNKESGNGVDLYKFETNIAFNTSKLSNQSLDIILNLDLDCEELPSTYFIEEETRQQKYRTETNS